jgi:ABC-type molybdate transport system substrate-binding protein
MLFILLKYILFVEVIKMKKILIFMTAFLFIFAVGCSSKSSNKEAKSNTTVKTVSSLEIEGKDISLSGVNLLPLNKEYLDKLGTLANANNKDAIQRMADNKELVVLADKTKVTVTKVSIGTAEVEVVDGDYKGTKGILPIEILQNDYKK